MKEKFINVPNLISLFRLIVLIPLVVYFFIINKNYIALSLSLLIAFLDIVDGYIARKFNQVTQVGTILDMIGDSIFIAAVTLTFLYLGYIDLVIFSLLAAHRVTRFYLASYIYIHTKGGYYSPLHIKFTGFSVLVYIFLIPFLIEFFGKNTADIATYSVILGTYAILIMFIIHAISSFKKGKLKITKF